MNCFYKNNMRTFFIFQLLLLINILPALAQYPDTLLEQGFKNPPVSARPKALWPWVNGNFSLSQITHELEEAAQKGMGGFDIWDVGSNMNPDGIMPDGPAFLSDESVNAIGHALKEAERLGLEIGLITSSSWNAGGAWVRPEHGAMGLFRTDTVVTGPSVFRGVIPYPEYPEVLKGKGLPWYSEVALLAVPDVPDSTIISTSMIIDLKGASGNKGTITWKVPSGRWRITRYVCMPTGQQLAVPSEASKGLMLDHFSAEAQKVNMEYVIGRLRPVLNDREKRSLKYLYEDSYEVNSAVWTPLLPEQFEKRYGYSIVPFLPVLDGLLINDQNTTERFLFDYTKLLSDLIIENHYVLGRKMAEAEGLGFYAEAGGPGKPIHNVPFEDLKALGSLTVPRGEFWNKHPQLDLLQIVKGISSASHIYNQKYVEAEAFTSVWLWQEGPAELKPLADRAMCEGLNRFVYHTFPHTPPESGMPGWIYNFGTIINTTNGWWSKSEGFHNYLARCSYMLQQGNFIGDVAFYYGDRAPNFVGPKRTYTTLGDGYDYDVVNSDIILHRMTVKDGKICLPHGQYYEVLVLPAGNKFNPQVLKKIMQLVSEGATVIGPRPSESYGLTDTATMNKSVRESAALLWGKCDSIHVQENQLGNGKVIWGKTIRDVLNEKGIHPDVRVADDSIPDAIDYIHRISGGTDIYFIHNKTHERLNTTIHFRVRNKVPEFWDPQTGEKFTIATFRSTDRGLEIPLSLGEHGSCFIVFTDENAGGQGTLSLPEREIKYTQHGEVMLQPLPVKELSGPWEVRFQHQSATPVSCTLDKLTSWHLSEDSAIRYFSGTASYRKNFILSAEILVPGKIYFLELNHVKEIAEVYLNGNKLGLHWHPSFRFDITPYLKAGENSIVIDVVNSINNLLVGDARKPDQFRITRSNISKLPNAWTTEFSNAPLIEAGLLGPVFILQADPL
jgi:hypothetical protein